MTDKNVQRSFHQLRSPKIIQIDQVISRSRSRSRQSHQSGNITYRSHSRQIVGVTPTKYDIDLYQRKINRMQVEINVLNDQLSLAKLKLKKSQDLNMKNQKLLKQNQDLTIQIQLKIQENMRKQREIDELRDFLNQSKFDLKSQQIKVEQQRNQNQTLRKIRQENLIKASLDSTQKIASIEQKYKRQINNFKIQSIDKQEKLRTDLNAAKSQIQIKNNIQLSLKHKLQIMKVDADSQINCLKDCLNSLKKELVQQRLKNDQKLNEYRTQLVQQTQERIHHIRNLTSTIEEALIFQIKSLNQTIRKKDDQLQFILSANNKFIDQNETIQMGLRDHINHLQDKIFTLQRQNQIQLFKTINRLKMQYDQNLNNIYQDFDQIKNFHQDKIQSLQVQINFLKKDNDLLGRQNHNIQQEYKKLSNEKQLAIKTFTEKIINLESAKQVDLRNYTNSMKLIQDDVKTKVDNLHKAIQNKNNQFDVLNAQISLKNQEINDLIQEINKLRDANRQKIRKLQTTNAMQQNSLNNLINNHKKEILELKRRIHEIQNQIDDQTSQNQLKLNLIRQDLTVQKQINQTLKSRNDFLYKWCKSLQNQIKIKRVNNVDILHDHNTIRRQTIQIRQQIYFQMKTIKDKQIQQLNNIFQLQKSRLQNQLLKRQYQIRDKKSELERFLIQYKKLQSKVGKNSKLDKNSEQNGKCKATLQAQILLTENIFNVINRL